MIARKTIVYVEDTTEIREMVRIHLEMFHNVRVIQAETGWLGLSRVMETHPDLVLLDWQLPDINGMQVYTAMQANQLTKKIPVIMLSTVDGPRDEALQAGIRQFFIKPFDLIELGKVVDALMNGSAPTDPRTQHPTKEFSAPALPDPAKIEAIGKWYERRPDEIFPPLAKTHRREWPRILARAVRSPQPADRGRAVIALALWHKNPNAPFNATDGQRHFWRYIRHALASSTPREALRRWVPIAPLALALLQPADHVNASLKRLWTPKLSAYCRQWVLEIMLRNQPDEAAQLADTALFDDHTELRSTATRILEQVGDERHVVALTHALSDSETIIRERAALALSRIGTETALIALEVTLQQGRAEAAQAAVLGLSLRETHETANALIKAAQERTEPAVLSEIAQALGKLHLRFPRCRSVLMELARHPDDHVREAAHVAIYD